MSGAKVLFVNKKNQKNFAQPRSCQQTACGVPSTMGIWRVWDQSQSPHEIANLS
jgi:hypothetical protein